jgi:uncharacterized membrane protein
MHGQRSIDGSQAAWLSAPRLPAAWLGALLISLVLVAGRASAQDDDPSAAESRAAPASTAVPTTAAPEAGDAAGTGTTVRAAEEPSSGDRGAAAQAQEPGGGLVAAILRGVVIAVGLIVVAVLARAVFVLTRTFIDATNEEPIGVESNWGGFGGASTGWHLTRPLSLLVAMLLLASLLYLALEAVLRAVDGRDQGGTGSAAAAAEPTDDAAASEAGQ